MIWWRRLTGESSRIFGVLLNDPESNRTESFPGSIKFLWTSCEGSSPILSFYYDLHYSGL